MQLRCPICNAKISGFDHMLEHLVAKHYLSKRQARFLTKKLVEWRQETLDPVPFTQADGSAKSH